MVYGRLIVVHGSTISLNRWDKNVSMMILSQPEYLI